MPQPDAPSPEKTLRYAKEIEGHADNASAALHGGLVVTYAQTDGGVGALRLPGPR